MESTKRRNSILFVLGSVVATCVIFLVYYLVELEPKGAVDAAKAYRDVETFGKLWLNGYGGHFFHFLYFGNLNWLAIPVVLVMLANFKKLSREAWAFLIVYGACVLIVMVHGYFTYRYKYTLSFLVIPFILYAGYQFFSRESLKHLRGWFMLVLLALAAYNAWKYKIIFNILIYTSFLVMPFLLYFAYVFFRSKKYPKLGKVVALGCIAMFSLWGVKQLLKPSDKVADTFNKRTFFNHRMPWQVFSALDTIDYSKGMVLTNNSPGVYYFTNTKAVYYKGVMDWCYATNDSITGGRTPAEVADYLKDSLNINYVVSSAFQDSFNATFTAFLVKECDRVIEDDPAFSLYRIRR